MLERELVTERVEEPELLLVRETVELPLTVSVPTADRVGVGAAEAERVTVTEAVPVLEADTEREAEMERVPVPETVPLRETDALPVVVRVLVVENVLDHVLTYVTVEEEELLTVLLVEGEKVRVAVKLREPVPLTEPVRVPDTLLEPVLLTEPLRLLLLLRVPVPELEAERVTTELRDLVGEVVPVRVALVLAL